MSKDKVSLADFAKQQTDGRQRSYLDTIPADVQEQLITTKASVAVAKSWLRSLGYEPTGLEAWRRKKRVERGIEP